MPTIHPPRTLAVLLTLLALPIAAAASDRLVVPLAPALALPEAQSVLAALPMRFGTATDAGAGGAPIAATSYARPTDWYGTKREYLTDGRVVPLTPVLTCQLALRYTLDALLVEAQQRGATAVVGLVSGPESAPIDSATDFSCAPGRASSTVELRGRMVGPTTR